MDVISEGSSLRGPRSADHLDSPASGGLYPGRRSCGRVTAGREVHGEAALDIIDEVPAAVGAMAAHTGGAVAWRPTHKRAARQQWVAGGATLGRDLYYAAIRSLYRTHVRLSHTARQVAMERPPDPGWDWILGRTIERTCRR